MPGPCATACEAAPAPWQLWSAGCQGPALALARSGADADSVPDKPFSPVEANRRQQFHGRQVVTNNFALCMR
jgi:hypothetical protein